MHPISNHIDVTLPVTWFDEEFQCEVNAIVALTHLVVAGPCPSADNPGDYFGYTDYDVHILSPDGRQFDEFLEFRCPWPEFDKDIQAAITERGRADEEAYFASRAEDLEPYPL